mgnify:CR=1 FL=1
MFSFLLRGTLSLKTEYERKYKLCKIITTDKIAKSNGPYSQGYTHNGFFFTAGQIGVEPSDGELHVHTIEEQTDRACRNIGIMLEAAGTSFDKVIKANCFIADMDDFDAFNQVYARYFTSRPARTCVAVKTLPKHALCEIEVIAALED